jgi:hypothetical protein
MTDYTITAARYAKNMMAVRCPSDTGYKTRAACLASYFARNRYSGREHAYIMSPSAAKRFEEHFTKGFGASCFSRTLIPPVPWVETDLETGPGGTIRLSRSIRVF